MRLVSQAFVEGRKQARPGFDEQDARRARVDVAEIPGECVPRYLRQRARHLHARGPAADHREGEKRFALGRTGGCLRLLERGQDAAPDQERVVECLEARRELFPLIVAEVGMCGAARDEKVVVRYLAIGQ